MSTSYIIRFTLIMTSVVALVLAGLFSLLKEQHDINEALFNRRAVLKAADDYLEKKVDNMSDEEVQAVFESKIDQYVLDMDGNIIEGLKADDIDMAKERKKPEAERRLPLYVLNSSNGEIYLLSVRGNGLWDEIWGTIALKDDFNTVAGVTFDHKAETPGLGAEIKDSRPFQEQFEGKKIYNEEGEYVSVTVRKGGARDKTHEVDGISGATVTSDGVTEMLDRGIQYYKPYFAKK